MAWTAPRTWTDGELVTAAIMNPHVRDNLNATWAHLIVRKTADESLSASTTLQDDNDLVLALAANEVWLVHYALRYSSPTAADLKVAFTFPSGGEIEFHSSHKTSTGASDDLDWLGTTTPTASQSFGSITTSVQFARIDGLFVNGGTAGNLTLQWAQVTSDAGSTIMKAHSTLWAVKLA